MLISHLGGINTGAERTLGCLALSVAEENSDLDSEKESRGFAGCCVGSRREASVSYVTPRLEQGN